MELATDRLEECVLPLVSKPNRYQNPFAHGRLPDFDRAGVRVCLVYPGPLEAGLAGVVIPNLREALVRAGEPDETLVDLAFAPAPDFEAELRRQELPLFGLAARRPLAAYDLLLALPESVLDLPDLVAMLELGGVELRAARRAAGDPVVVMAGEAAYTPKPAAPWVDAFMIGDPEAFAADLVEAGRALRRGEGRTRGEIRGLFEGRDGVFVPEIKTGASEAEHRNGNGDGSTVRARWLAHLPPIPEAPIVPYAETEAEGLVVEIARPLGLEDPASAPPPLRVRPLERVLRGTEAALAASGHGEVVLASTAGSRHPEIVPLLEAMNQRFGPHGVKFRLEDVDPARVAPALARELRKGRRTRFTFEPLAPSARLREAIGRPLSAERLFEAAETAWRGGWSAIRFQVLLGLPGETADDREEWLKTMEAIQSLRAPQGGAPRLSVEIVPFVPRPHTRWELEAPADENACLAVAEGWRRRLTRRKVKVSVRSPGAARVEALLLRGDERTAEVVEEVSRLGARRQSDPDAFSAPRWEEAMARLGLAGDLPHDLQSTPWSHVVLESPPLGNGGGESHERTDARTGPAGAGASTPGFGAPAWKAGRRPRRAGRGREGRQAERYRLRFSKGEPARFTAHLDVTRSLERAFRRAQLPLAVSQGKGRRPKLSFGPPLPLGMTSDAEYFDVAFAREVPESFVTVFNQALPAGLQVTAQAPIRTEPDSLNSAIQIAVYEVSFPDTLVRDHFGGMPSGELTARLRESVDRARSAKTIEVTKVRGEDSRTFNARPSLIRAAVSGEEGERPRLGLTLALNRPDSVRPELLTTVLCTWADFDERLLRVHRSGLMIPGRNQVLDPLAVVASGFAWWQQTARRGGAVS
jgi:radical SAM-linked protein